MPDQDPKQHSELASFGEELRREREIRGISLKEIADATKISRRFLEAIERNDHKTLPAPVFTRGFVREYARYLGLSSEEMVSRYNFAAAGDDRIEQSDHLDRLVHPGPVQSPPPLKKTGFPPAYARIDRNVIVTALIVAALAAVTWWAVTSKRRRAEAAPPPPVVAVVPRDAGVVARAALGEAPNAPVDDNRLHLTMEVTQNAWITLEVDGETAVNEELLAGTTRTFDADRHFRFRTIGNAAGLTLTLNGKKLPALGRDGEVVRNRVFDRPLLEALP